MPTEEIKNAIKQALADTDWTQLPDVKIENKSEFVTYRSMLRTFLDNAPAAFTPVPPEPIWTVVPLPVVNENNPTVEGMQNL